MISVPPGTCIVDAESGETIADLTGNSTYTFLKGGRGGLGNWHFKSSVNQAPRFAQDGEQGKSMRVGLILKIIADVGLVGLPNAGKSSFINCVTNARSKVAPYPFTTIIPSLGMMRIYGKDILIADIPGLIEGSGSGMGMGIKFLKHIERTRVLLFMIDVSSDEYLDTFDVLKKELSAYSPALLSKSRAIVLTKVDNDDLLERIENFKDKYEGEKIYPLSIYREEYVSSLSKVLYEMVS